MSLPAPNRQRGLFDVPVLVGDLFADAKDHYRLFREQVLPALYAVRDELAALYCADNGRPAIEPVLALGVTLLQFMHKVPDAKAAELVRLHMGWKYALDLDIGYAGFHPTSLVKFRDRLADGDRGRIGFDAMLKALRQAGLVKKSSPQRLDSTHILGAVARMSRLELIRETIRLFLIEVQAHDLTDLLPNWTRYHDYYIDCEIPWHRADHAMLKRGASQAGADALALITWVKKQPPMIRDSDRALLLERVFLEQYEVIAEAPQQRRTTAAGSVVNPHDPDVQWAAKDQNLKKQWEGYKAQLCETVDENGAIKRKGEPTEQFLTEVTTTEAIASDLDGRQRVEANQQAAGQELPTELIVDGAYISAELLAEADAQGRTLTGPAPPPNGPKDCFPSDRFNVDITQRTATCPAGHASTQCSQLEEAKTGKISYRFEWGALCDNCPLKAQCTHSCSGRRTLLVGEHHEHLQQRRQQMKTDAYPLSLNRRAAIEGTISEFTRLGGRRSRYRSLAKTTLANYFVGAAVNARRYIRLLQWNLQESPANT